MEGAPWAGAGRGIDQAGRVGRFRVVPAVISVLGVAVLLQEFFRYEYGQSKGADGQDEEAGKRSKHGSFSGAGDNPQDRITITARQLEGIIRLAEAHARARLRDEVTEIDAEFAIELMKFSLNQITRDPETGEYDYDAFISGQTKSRRSKLNQVRDAINFLHKDAGGSFDENEMIEFAIKEGQGTLTEEYVKGTIQQMLIDGTLYRPRRGKLDKP